MKNKIGLAISVLLVICLALTGCGTESSNSGNESEDVNSSKDTSTTSEAIDVYDTTASEYTNEGTNDLANSHDSIMNAEGKYIYNVQEYEIPLSINIWDYINGDIWDKERMFSDLGYTLDEGSPLMAVCHNSKVYTRDLGNGEEISASIFADYRGAEYFEGRDFGNMFSLYAVPNPSKKERSFEICLAGYKGDYYYFNESRYFKNPLDMIILCAFMLEQNRDGIQYDYIYNFFNENLTDSGTIIEFRYD